MDSPKGKTILALLSAALILLISGCIGQAPPTPTPTPTPTKTIVLGAPLSTAYLYGYDAEKAMRLAVEEINDAGGIVIGGERYQFKLEVMDTRDLEPGVPTAEALLVIEKLVTEKGAKFILGGPVRSEAGLASMDLDAKYKTVHIFTTGTLTPALHKRVAEEYDKYKYVFRISHEAAGLSKEAFEILSYLKDKYGFNKIYIMVQDVAHARAIGTLVKSKLEEAGGWEVLGPDIYPTGATDYSTSLLKAKDAGSQLLFVWMDHPETSILIRQWHDLQIPALPVTGICSAMEVPQAWNETKGYVEFVIACPCNTGNAYTAYEPAMKFFNAYKKRWGIEPEGYGAVSSYTVVYVLKDALERAGSLDPDAIVEALEKTDYMGPYGRIRFDPKSHQVIQSYDPKEGAVTCWFQWLNGKRVQIWPPTAGIALSEIKVPPWMVPTT